MNGIFIDSDIFIDLLAKRQHHIEAGELLMMIQEQKVKAYTTPIVLANVDYIITKFANKAVSRRAIKSLRKYVSVLTMDQTIVDSALESEFIDFEDAMQYYSAEKQQMDFIVTRNKKDYRKGDLKVVTAREFVDMYSARGKDA
ncbi:MAG: PIN domain-containing protein [Nitrospirae bacterium]|nr:PIN domain-containing protein [Nitrospirota bacterium]